MRNDPAQTLREHGVQVTAQRLAVLQAVSRKPHSTADVVAEEVRSEIGTISRQGVYDALGILVQFQSGTVALLSAMLATPFEGRFAVYGSHGWAEVRDKAHPESPEGWVLTTCMKGNRKQVKDYPPSQAVLANLEAFADAAQGRAPYPVPQEQMIANIAALEAIFKSARSGNIEKV